MDLPPFSIPCSPYMPQWGSFVNSEVLLMLRDESFTKSRRPNRSSRAFLHRLSGKHKISMPSISIHWPGRSLPRSVTAQSMHSSRQVVHTHLRNFFTQYKSPELVRAFPNVDCLDCQPKQDGNSYYLITTIYVSLCLH